MKRIVPVIVIVAVVGVAAYFGWTWYTGSNVAATGLSGSGTIETEQIAITPQTSARILTAPSEEGVAVKKGDVLYTLDSSLAELTLRQAVLGVDAAEANLQTVKDKSGHTKAEVAAAEAQLEQAKVAADMAQVQFGYTTVTSPIDGVIASIAARAGENAVPGSTLALVSNPASLTVTIFVPESQIGQVTVGQKGSLTTDSVSKTYNGVVVFIATSAEFTPASIETKDQRVKLVYQVKLRITDADAALKPGMPADVVLQ